MSYSFREEAERLDKENSNDELREMLYKTIVEHGIDGVTSYESDADGVDETGNILRGVHIAEMIIAVQPIKDKAEKKGFLSKLNPF